MSGSPRPDGGGEPGPGKIIINPGLILPYAHQILKIIAKKLRKGIQISNKTIYTINTF
jgi:hypothetical protein